MVLRADARGAVRSTSSRRTRLDLRDRARESAERDMLAKVVRLFKILAAALIAALVARFGLAIVVAWITSGGRPDPGYAALVYGFLPAAIGGASTIPLHRSVDTRVGLGWSVLVMIAGASLPWLILFR